MDIGAYKNIEDLEILLKENNIEIPRLRGLRLMANEEKVSVKELVTMLHEHLLRVADGVLTSDDIGINGCCVHTLGKLSNCIIYSKKEEDSYPVPAIILWKKINGKRRKILKYHLKRAKKQFNRQWNMFNKYAGKKNILYIHARIGGGNWSFYDCDHIKKEPWYLDSCDDCYDTTYCDIYAKIRGE